MRAPRLASLFLFASSLSAACSSAEPDDATPVAPADTATMTPGASAPGAGTYTVPVTPELEPFATFDVTDVRFREHGGELELSYELPELLVGGRQQLSFRGSSAADASGSIVLSGDSGVATCRSELEQMRCDELLARVALDTDKLERALAGFSAEEQAARRAVAQQFSVDPIGVLRF